MLTLTFIALLFTTRLDAAKPELTLCQGQFALCAAATCKLTGRMMPGTKFPEVVCECPVLPGPALADVTGGNMKGDCTAPVDPVTKKTGVWSLFWPQLDIPQKIDGHWRKNVAALPHNCPATDSSGEKVQFAQCFSFACRNVRTVEGVTIADCYCPAQTVPDKSTNTEFAVQAGQCQSGVCSQYPVGAPFVVPGNVCAER
jgi:hypothetical protein